MTTFDWNEKTEKAAYLLSKGELSDEAIASEVNVARSTLSGWKNHPDFAAKVEALVEAMRAAFRRRAIGMVERRVDRLNRDWLKLQRVIEERADSGQMQGVAGGATGLIVHNVKGVGKGDDFQLIDLYEVDTGLLRELREIEKQAAQELGQWVEKSTVDQTVKSYETANSPDNL